MVYIDLDRFDVVLEVGKWPPAKPAPGWPKPKVAFVTDGRAVSYAESFLALVDNTKIGPIVGEPTAGWIIYTSNIDLVDGSVLRIPFIRITSTDGKNMELVPRPVDVPVTRAIGEGLLGKDTQLDSAVRELMRTLPASTRRGPP